MEANEQHKNGQRVIDEFWNNGIRKELNRKDGASMNIHAERVEAMRRAIDEIIDALNDAAGAYADADGIGLSEAELHANLLKELADIVAHISGLMRDACFTLAVQELYARAANGERYCEREGTNPPGQSPAHVN